jgi:hypothetical protein
MYAITDTQGNHRNLNQNTINSTLTSESWSSTMSMQWAQSDVPQNRLDILRSHRVYQTLNPHPVPHGVYQYLDPYSF